ncbi:Flagellar motor rotation protein MotA [hydrothermal vent metagenome]|uniref:Flagellar motor rotation protein MotA n=1 Tax=hydrothermal vent metagenome TaxID=652676 RepID=A0A3B1CB78_9ZZZZ
MDIATVIGLLAGIGLLGASMSMGAGGIGSFVDVPSVLVVIGGTSAATLVMFPLQAVLQSFSTVLKAFQHKPEPHSDVIKSLIALSTTARKEGLLALEKKKIGDPFINKGVRLLVDGIDQNTIRSMLTTEVHAIQDRHQDGAQVFEQIGMLAPAFGMIGTLIGLVQMLQSLSDPSAIGPAMAISLTTTLYGALIANLVALPFAKKLSIRSKEETSIKEIIIEGIVSISKKENPNIMKAKLNAFLAPKQQAKIR